MKILLIEDDPSYALEVEMLIEELGHDLLGIIDNGKEALTFIVNHHIDLIIMDIGIKGNLNGIDVAKQINNKNIPIIFITASNDAYTYSEAFVIQPYGFIVKPFDKLTLKACIEVTLRSFSQAVEKTTKDGMFIKVNRKLIRLYYSKIQCIKSDGNYVYIKTEDKRFILKTSLTKLKKKLPDESFMRIHKRYIVHLWKVESLDFENNTVTIDSEQIPFGRNYKKELVRRLEG